MADLDNLLADFLGFDAAVVPDEGEGPSIDSVIDTEFGLAAKTVLPKRDLPPPPDYVPPPPLADMLAERDAADPDRMPWPADWLTTRDPGDWAKCRALWCSVLLSCVRDALKGNHVDKSTVAQTYVATAGWIGSRDFHMVCALAGVDGVAVADRLAQIGRDPAAIARVLRMDNLVRVPPQKS